MSAAVAGSDPAPLPVDAYLAELGAIAAAASADDPVLAALERGTAPPAAVRRLVLEHCHVVKWTTAELPLLVANAPDVYSFTLDASAHYRHWAETFASEAGYLGHPGHLASVVDWCRQLGIADGDVRAYVPLPETIAMTFTLLFHVRRAYDEGVAVWRHAGERIAGRTARVRLGDALGAHYGVRVAPEPPPAHADDAAGALLRAVVTTTAAQARCRQAVRDVVATVACRTRALARVAS
jgi:hypothetical protein